VNWWNNVHVQDLGRGYVALLKELEKSGVLGWNGYWFAETEEHQCKNALKSLLVLISRVIQGRIFMPLWAK